MHARTLAVGLVIAGAFACGGGSSEPEIPTPVPTTALATPAGVVPSTPTLTPVSGFLDDRNCDDFATQDEAQAFFEEGGGPEQDLHNLDPDDNGRACDEAGATPVAPASAAPNAAPATAAPARTAPRAVASPQQQTHVSGDVEGPQGGSSSRSSCETDGEERC